MAIDGCSAPGTCLNWPDCFCEIPLSTWRLCGKESMLISLQCKERPLDLVCNGRLTCWWSFRLGWFHRFGRALVLLYLLERQRRTRWGRRMQWGISFLILCFLVLDAHETISRNDLMITVGIRWLFIQNETLPYANYSHTRMRSDLLRFSCDTSRSHDWNVQYLMQSIDLCFS